MRWLTLIISSLAFIVTIFFFNTRDATTTSGDKSNKINLLSNNDRRRTKLLRLEQVTAGFKNYTVNHHLNNRFCFLINMRLASGSKRFYIYDLQNKTIVQSGLVAHGSSNYNWGDSVVFSNAIGSNCTSLGKYKIGKSYFGKFGLAYKLYGLDETNSNAFNRFVVLHSHTCVPDNETFPGSICKSWGCPTVSPLFLSTLKTYIERAPEPMLLCIFN